MATLKNFFYGTLMAGLGMANLSACSQKDKEPKDDEKSRTELTVSDFNSVSEYNAALFESCRSDIVFTLFFVENCYPYAYNDGTGHWTVADGLTVLYDENGNGINVTADTKPLTKEEAEIYTMRFLKFQIWPIIKNINIPMDRNTMISACAFGYCIGAGEFKQSNFLKYLKAGKSGTDLGKALSGYRTPQGLLQRWYFLAALLSNKIQFSDLLDLRADGCYNLETVDIVACCKDENGRYKKKKGKYGLIYEVETDKNGFCKWNFSRISAQLKKAKEPMLPVKLNIKDGKKVLFPRQLVKDIVPDYVWAEVSDPSGKKLIGKPIYQVDVKELNAANMNDTAYIAYQKRDYDNALRAGRIALDLAKDNKQRGAATFNIGITYSALGRLEHAENTYYDSAVHYLEQSLAYNERTSTRDSLEIAKQKLAEYQEQQKLNAKRNSAAGRFVAGMGVVAAVALKRRKYLIQKYHKVK